MVGIDETSIPLIAISLGTGHNLVTGFDRMTNKMVLFG